MKQINILILTIITLLCISFTNATLITTGLEGYWSFDNVSGTTIINEVIGQTNFTTTGSPSYITGMNNDALQTSSAGSQQYASADDSLIFYTGMDDFTYNFWLRTDGNLNWDYLSFQKSSAGYDGLFFSNQACTGTGGNLQIGYYNGGYPFCLVAVTDVTNTGWNYITFVRKSGQVYLYVNGTLDTNASDGSANIVSSGIPLQIARRGTSATPVGVDIDELSFYNVGLNDTDITTLFNQLGNPLYQLIVPPSTVYIDATVCNLTNLTIGSNQNITINWSNASGSPPIEYTLSVNDIALLTEETLLTNTTSNSFKMNNTYWNTLFYPTSWYFQIFTVGMYGNSTSYSCNFTVCENNWVSSVQPCINGTRLNTYIDTNYCSQAFNKPADTYSVCVVTTYVENSWSEDIVIIGILFLFLIISTACAITIHEAFFGVNALIVTLMWVTFRVYDYPSILLYLVPFIIISFGVMWVVVHRVKR